MSKCIVIYNGTDVHWWQGNAQRERRNRERGCALVSVGRLSWEKGYSSLLQVVATLRAEGRNVTLTIVGDGPEREILRSLAQKNGIAEFVVFAGQQADIRPFLQNADIFVLSSLTEGFPFVLLEAMASGIPCVATDVGGVPELITHNVTGILVQQSVASLASGIVRLDDDHALRQRITAAAFTMVNTLYSLDRSIREIETLLCDVRR